MNRRSFIYRTSAFIVALSMPVWSSLTGCVRANLRPKKLTVIEVGLRQEQWRMLAVVQDHLLPSETGAPGARDINALRYLQSVLTDPTLDPADRALFKDGLSALETMTLSVTGKQFIDLSSEQREVVLRDFENLSFGRPWLGGMLDRLFEALLGDPVYGGNPGGIGWAWLDHRPGFPRPASRPTPRQITRQAPRQPIDKRYFMS